MYHHKTNQTFDILTNLHLGHCPGGTQAAGLHEDPREYGASPVARHGLKIVAVTVLAT